MESSCVHAEEHVKIAFSQYGCPAFPDASTPIEYRRKKCYRSADDVFRQAAKPTVRAIEAIVAGMKPEGNRCPHRGFDLASVPIEDGCVTCPLHGLKWQLDGKLVRLSEDRSKGNPGA